MTNQELRIWAIEQAIKRGSTNVINEARELMQFINSANAEKIDSIFEVDMIKKECAAVLDMIKKESAAVLDMFNTMPHNQHLNIYNAHGVNYAIPETEVIRFSILASQIDVKGIRELQLIYAKYRTENRSFIEVK